MRSPYQLHQTMTSICKYARMFANTMQVFIVTEVHAAAVRLQLNEQEEEAENRAEEDAGETARSPSPSASCNQTISRFSAQNFFSALDREAKRSPLMSMTDG